MPEYSAPVQIVSLRIALLSLVVLVTGCASRPLPKFQKPIARAQFQSVRTTAYTHSEADHVKYGRCNALGGQLQCEQVKSAAADWSRWPAGTLFRIQETGEIYRVDDYGWALSGTNTIDLYKPSRAAMNAWGVRRVTIENLQWGDPHRSLAILRSRSKYRHLKRMVDEYRQQGLAFPSLAPEQSLMASSLESPRAIAVSVTPGGSQSFYSNAEAQSRSGSDPQGTRRGGR